MADGGYDVSDYRDIHPDFGNLEHADAFITKAHELGLRVLIDLVPNHSSDAHPWFQAAQAAPKGSPEREAYIFRDGLGEDGDLPPNNWPAMFGGGAWERTTDPDGRPGQWYLHLFAPNSRTGTGTTPRWSRSSTPSCGSGSTAGSTVSGSTWPTRWPRHPDCPISTSTPRASRSSPR